MRIREIIKEQGMTSKELAERLGMSVSALNQHINGNPSIRVVEKIASALEVPLWQLFVSPSETAAQAGSTLICPKCGARLNVKLAEEEKQE